jgi:hypothetical protein
MNAKISTYFWTDVTHAFSCSYDNSTSNDTKKENTRKDKCPLKPAKKV